MDLDRFKQSLRLALGAEVEKISARGDERARIDVIALLEGAKCQLVKRDESGHAPPPELCGLPDAARHKYFRLGWEIAARVG